MCAGTVSPRRPGGARGALPAARWSGTGGLYDGGQLQATDDMLQARREGQLPGQPAASNVNAEMLDKSSNKYIVDYLPHYRYQYLPYYHYLPNYLYLSSFGFHQYDQFIIVCIDFLKRHRNASH